MKPRKTLYDKKLTDFDGIFKYIKSGMHLVTSSTAAEPQKLVSELKKRIESWNNLALFNEFSRSPHLITEPNKLKHITHTTGFISPEMRDLVNKGKAAFTPTNNSMAPENFSLGIWHVDVVLLQVSPPNKKGFVSLGISSDYISAATKKAKIVLAQVNKHMPYTYGDSEIPLSKITALVEFDEPLMEFSWPKPGAVEKKIGKYIASLVPDGATLQLGNGKIPDAVLSHLGKKKDLGIHTEMFCDNIIPLVKKGVITGKRKNIDKGKIVSGFIMGTKKVYKFVDRNPHVLMKSWSYTNDGAIIAKNDRVISINSALQIDLAGQVNAESIGNYEFSSSGGQLDFVRGARLSKNGKTIIAFPSTAKGEKISRIVPYFPKGSVVTTPRHDIDYVVTEYGIARLRGKTLGERARLLTKLAHPKFKPVLKRAIQENKKWTK